MRTLVLAALSPKCAAALWGSGHEVTEGGGAIF